MKRIDNLYDKIISLGNLRLADENGETGEDEHIRGQGSRQEP